MGFMDKIKETANTAANKAQEGISKGQAKLDGVQTKHDANEFFRVLGQAYYVERAGRGLPGQFAGVESSVIPRIEAVEAQLGPVPMPPPLPAQSQPPAPGAPPAGVPAGQSGWSTPPQPQHDAGWTSPPQQSEPDPSGWATPEPPSHGGSPWSTPPQQPQPPASGGWVTPGQ